MVSHSSWNYFKRTTKRSAKLYKKIWTEKGSPLMVYMNEIVEKLNIEMDQKNLMIELV